MAWLDGWNHRLKYTIDHNRIDGDLTNFPVHIVISSGVGRNNFDASVVFDELTVTGTMFQDNFSGGGSNWYDVTGTADYSSGYLKHNADNEQARTTDEIQYGSNWELTFKFKQYGSGDYNDQLRVSPLFDNSGVAKVQVYMRTYSSGSNELTLYVEGSSRGSVGTYNWYNERGNWISTKIKRIGNTIYFKVWVPPDVEPSGWNITTSCTDSLPQQAYFDFLTTYTDSNGTGLDDIFVKGILENELKIAVTDYTGINQLYTEIESWDYDTKKAYLWTKVPTVNSGTDTIVYLYYDKDHLDNDLWVGETGTAIASNVWTNDYTAVWHMNTDIDTTIKDSVLDYPATPNIMDSTNYINTPYGPGLSFNSGDYLTPTTINLVNQDTTIEVLFKLQNFSSDRQYIFTSQTDPPSGETWTYQTGTTILISSTQKFAAGAPGNHTSNGSVYSTDIVDEDTWIHWTSVLPNGDYSKLYKNGYLEGTATIVNPTKGYTHNETYIGARNDDEGTDYLKSDIGLLTLSSGVRSAAWIKASYFSVFDNLMTVASDLKPVFTASGTVTVDSLVTADIPVRLYRRSTGELVSSTSTTNSGTFELDTPYNEEHYITALYTSSGTNALIYDWIAP